MKCSDICYYLCAYLDNELESGKLEILKEHLESCPKCRNEFTFQKCLKDRIKNRFCNVKAPETLRKSILATLDRASDYRESGIKMLDLIPWGAHMAQLCKSEDELVDLLIPYTEMGLRENELCVWITSEMSSKEIEEALSRKIEHLQKYIDSGQLQIFSYKEWFFTNGRFDAQNLLNTGLKKQREAASKGYDGLRITGDLFWLDQSNWRSFMDFENCRNNTVRGQKLLAICAFKENQFTVDNMADVLKTHQCVLSKIDGSWKVRKSAEACIS